jgi:Ca2+-binding RTX toxin-like protein
MTFLIAVLLGWSGRTQSLVNRRHSATAARRDSPRGDVEVVTGGAGNDTLVDLLGRPSGFLGGAGDDKIVGGDGADSTLVGGDGDDSIYGADGKDMLWGDAGDDVLSGGADADLIDGGADHDHVHSQDLVKDSAFCGTGIDRVTADWFDDVAGCERKG